MRKTDILNYLYQELLEVPRFEKSHAGTVRKSGRGNQRRFPPKWIENTF